MSTPKIAFHGGKCCGVKTIHGLGDNPKKKAVALKGKESIGLFGSDNDQYGSDVSSAWNMYNQECPAETYAARIDRYIKYLDAVRPNGIIEIILAENEKCEDADECDCDDHQNREWGPLLLERGFVVVNDCHNSNSGNRIYIYHRKRDGE